MKNKIFNGCELLITFIDGKKVNCIYYHDSEDIFGNKIAVTSVGDIQVSKNIIKKVEIVEVKPQETSNFFNKKQVKIPSNCRICTRCSGTGKYLKHGQCYGCGGCGYLQNI